MVKWFIDRWNFWVPLISDAKEKGEAMKTLLLFLGTVALAVLGHLGITFAGIEFKVFQPYMGYVSILLVIIFVEERIFRHHEKHLPKLIVKCDTNEIPRSRPCNSEDCFFNVMVTTESLNALTGCTGFLHRVEKVSGEKITESWAEAQRRLPFEYANNPDTLNKTINRGHEAFLNIFAIRNHGVVLFYPAEDNHSMAWDALRDKAGKDVFEKDNKYILRVSVVDNSSQPEFFSLEFIYTGNQKTSHLHLCTSAKPKKKTN